VAHHALAAGPPLAVGERGVPGDEVANGRRHQDPEFAGGEVPQGDPVLDDGDENDRELDRLSTKQRVDQELQEVKMQLGKGTEAVTEFDVEKPTV
jgi:hypothetical protein